MSAKKSWDIRPHSRAKSARPDTVIPWARPAAAERGRSLKDRRRAARRRLLVLFGVLLLILVGALIYIAWRPELRIKSVAIQSSDAEALDPLVKGTLIGTYMSVLPRNSIFFFSKERIRNAILDAHPEISAVSVSRTGFDSIGVKTIERASAFDWCGTTPDATAPCYESDAEGFIFAPIIVDASASGTTTPSKDLRIYAPLVEASSTNETPIRSHVADASAIPDVLRFERAMVALGANVESVELRGDEADIDLRSGTRITYVLGHEEAAAELAATAFPQLNLNDGSILYVDLRFDGKVYLKRVGEK